MKAIMLAAGRGTRLSNHGAGNLPKPLLRFGGRTLLARHIGTLRALGIEELVLVVGYRADRVLAEVDAVGAGDFVRPLHNPDFLRGNILSLLTARDTLCAGAPVLVMDADVLYDAALLRKLVETRHPSCLLMDREFDEGDEPVKLCLRDGVPVEFRKDIGEVAYDTIGEASGFLRASPAFARALVAASEAYVDAGRLDEPYEEAIRDVLLSDAPPPVGVEDITGIPWIEIDFPADVERAENEILPRIEGGAPYTL